MYSSAKNVKYNVFSILIIICCRWVNHEVSSDIIPLVMILAWIILSATIIYRSLSLGKRIFSKAHAIVRGCTGAAILIATSNASLLASGSRVFAPVWGLIAICMICYVLSGTVVTGKFAGKSALVGARPPSGEYLDIWLPIGFGRVLRRDISIISYAIYPGDKPITDESRRRWTFSNHFVARPMLYALLMISVVEMGIGHILLRNFDQAIVWGHVALGALFIIYVTGILRSFTRLPTIVEGGMLKVRMTVLFKADIAIDSIASVQRLASMPPDAGGLVANGAILVAPNILVRASRAFEATRMFKPDQKVTAVAFYVDSPDDLIAKLNFGLDRK